MNTPIPHRPYQKIREDECLICLEILEGEIAEISCGHIFHYHCIQPWIAKKGVHRSCCLCEKNTEIINIINFPYQNEIKNNVKKYSEIQNISLPVSNHITHRNSSQSNQPQQYQPQQYQPQIQPQQYQHQIQPQQYQPQLEIPNNRYPEENYNLHQRRNYQGNNNRNNNNRNNNNKWGCCQIL